MAKYLLLGVGGTGAKILEAFVHLAASGWIKTADTNDEVHIRMIDLDSTCGNIMRLKSCIDNYEQLSCIANRNWTPMKIAKIPDGAGFVWNAGMNIDQNIVSRTLNGISELNANQDSDAAQIMLLKSFYTDEELNLNLDAGFRGLPRIGSLLWAQKFDDDLKNRMGFWSGLFDHCGISGVRGNDEAVYVMIVGSVFGGTGASGLPVFAKKIHSYLNSGDDVVGKNNYVGLTLMFPYFSFGSVEPGAGLHADANEFAFNSKVASKYYTMDSELTNCVRSMYLAGDPPVGMRVWNKNGEPTNAVAAVGNSDQENPAIPAEIAAASGIAHFFVKTSGEGSNVYVLNKSDREEGQYMNWSDLPTTMSAQRGLFNAGLNMETAMKRLVRFAAMMKRYYADNMNNGRATILLPFAQMGHSDLQDLINGLGPIFEYCDMLYSWAGNISVNNGENLFGRNISGQAIINVERADRSDMFGMPIGRIISAVNREMPLKTPDDLIKALAAACN